MFLKVIAKVIWKIYVYVILNTNAGVILQNQFQFQFLFLFYFIPSYFFLDIDECSTFSHNCSQLCQNTEGGHKCYCVEGYRLALDNKTCHCKSTKYSYCM